MMRSAAPWRSSGSLAAAATLACLAATAVVSAPQVPLPRIPMEVPGPPAGTEMTKEYVDLIGRMAYVWGYALVNSHNRREAFSMVPKPGLQGGVLPVAPVGQNAMLTDTIKPEQTFVTCPNQDVVYGAGAFALDSGPVVFQVPDFGDRFWVYALYDARTDEFAEIGKPYGTKPGFYLMVGPNWKEERPQGIIGVVRSSTELAFIAPRVFKNDTPEDAQAVQAVLGKILFYPLSEFDGKLKTTDWTKLPSLPSPPGAGKSETKWVQPEKFFDQLPTVMSLVPPLPGEEALYGWIRSAWVAAEADPSLKKVLTDAFVAADKEMIDPLFQWRHNGRIAGNGWYSAVNNAQWGTDYLNRTATAKSNMYENRPIETKYMFRDLDNQGQPLLGQNGYSVTFPKDQLPPVKGFWSMTLYSENHFFHPNPLNRYSLGTKSKSLRYGADGSLTLYFGATSPGADQESNWLPAPDGPFSLYLRCYWPDQKIIDGSWTPPNVEKFFTGAPKKQEPAKRPPAQKKPAAPAQAIAPKKP